MRVWWSWEQVSQGAGCKTNCNRWACLLPAQQPQSTACCNTHCWWEQELLQQGWLGLLLLLHLLWPFAQVESKSHWFWWRRSWSGLKSHRFWRWWSWSGFQLLFFSLNVLNLLDNALNHHYLSLRFRLCDVGVNAKVLWWRSSLRLNVARLFNADLLFLFIDNCWLSLDKHRLMFILSYFLYLHDFLHFLLYFFLKDLHRLTCQNRLVWRRFLNLDRFRLTHHQLFNSLLLLSLFDECTVWLLDWIKWLFIGFVRRFCLFLWSSHFNWVVEVWERLGISYNNFHFFLHSWDLHWLSYGNFGDFLGLYQSEESFFLFWLLDWRFGLFFGEKDFVNGLVHVDDCRLVLDFLAMGNWLNYFWLRLWFGFWDLMGLVSFNGLWLMMDFKFSLRLNFNNCGNHFFVNHSLVLLCLWLSYVLAWLNSAWLWSRFRHIFNLKLNFRLNMNFNWLFSCNFTNFLCNLYLLLKLSYLFLGKLLLRLVMHN